MAMRMFRVAVVGTPNSVLSGSEKGVGKSCLCNRFVHPDNYGEDHSSRISSEEWIGNVVCSNHFVYWGAATKFNAQTGRVRFQLLEFTEFIHQDSGYVFPFEADYIRRACDPIDSPGKVAYVPSRQEQQDNNSIVSKEEINPVSNLKRKGSSVVSARTLLEEGKTSVSGYVCVFDPTLAESNGLFGRQIEFLRHLLNEISKLKKPCVIACTKCDHTDASKEKIKRGKAQLLSERKNKRNIAFVESSARDNVNVDEIFFALVISMNRRKSLGPMKRNVNSIVDVSTYREVEFQRRRTLKLARSDFQALLETKVTRFDTYWEETKPRLEKQPEYQRLVDLEGDEVVRKMFCNRLMEVKLLEASLKFEQHHSVATGQEGSDFPGKFENKMKYSQSALKTAVASHPDLDASSLHEFVKPQPEPHLAVPHIQPAQRSPNHREQPPLEATDTGSPADTTNAMVTETEVLYMGGSTSFQSNLPKPQPATANGHMHQYGGSASLSQPLPAPQNGHLSLESEGQQKLSQPDSAEALTELEEEELKGSSSFKTRSKSTIFSRKKVKNATSSSGLGKSSSDAKELITAGEFWTLPRRKKKSKKSQTATKEKEEDKPAEQKVNFEDNGQYTEENPPPLPPRPQELPPIQKHSANSHASGGDHGDDLEAGGSSHSLASLQNRASSCGCLLDGEYDGGEPPIAVAASHAEDTASPYEVPHKILSGSGSNMGGGHGISVARELSPAKKAIPSNMSSSVLHSSFRGGAAGSGSGRHPAFLQAGRHVRTHKRGGSYDQSLLALVKHEPSPPPSLPPKQPNSSLPEGMLTFSSPQHQFATPSGEREGRVISLGPPVEIQLDRPHPSSPGKSYRNSRPTTASQSGCSPTNGPFRIKKMSDSVIPAVESEGFHLRQASLPNFSISGPDDQLGPPPPPPLPVQVPMRPPRALSTELQLDGEYVGQLHSLTESATTAHTTGQAANFPSSSTRTSLSDHIYLESSSRRRSKSFSEDRGMYAVILPSTDFDEGNPNSPSYKVRRRTSRRSFHRFSEEHECLYEQIDEDFAKNVIGGNGVPLMSSTFPKPLFPDDFNPDRETVVQIQRWHLRFLHFYQQWLRGLDRIVEDSITRNGKSADHRVQGSMSPEQDCPVSTDPSASSVTVLPGQPNLFSDNPSAGDRDRQSEGAEQVDVDRPPPVAGLSWSSNSKLSSPNQSTTPGASVAAASTNSRTDDCRELGGEVRRASHSSSAHEVLPAGERPREEQSSPRPAPPDQHELEESAWTTLLVRSNTAPSQQVYRPVAAQASESTHLVLNIQSKTSSTPPPVRRVLVTPTHSPDSFSQTNGSVAAGNLAPSLAHRSAKQTSTQDTSASRRWSEHHVFNSLSDSVISSNGGSHNGHSWAGTQASPGNSAAKINSGYGGTTTGASRTAKVNSGSPSPSVSTPQVILRRPVRSGGGVTPRPTCTMSRSERLSMDSMLDRDHRERSTQGNYDRLLGYRTKQITGSEPNIAEHLHAKKSSLV